MSAISAALVLLGTGCSGVYVLRPVGEKPHALVAADWEGTWVMDKAVAKVKVVDAGAGKLQLAGVEEKDGKPTLVIYTVFITESGKTLFASLRNDGQDADTKPYVWARLRHEPDQVLLWWPDVKRFGELVGAGKLSGKLDGSDVLLDSPSAEQVTALISGVLGPVFDAECPAVLRRVAR
ncbi:MAG: hypothetical protein ABIQ12_04080 [Opitutaceae bacterium]